jgi:hypothetical protein
LFLLLLLLLTGSVVTAAVPPTRPPSRPFDFSKLPPGAVIVIGDDARDALQQPGIIVLSPERFKEMLDQIEQLKRASTPDRPEAPSRCKISGRVEGDVVSLTLQYEFETRKRKALVALGGQKLPGASAAWPTAVVLDDGRLPLLPPPGDDGFVVQVDAPAMHKLTLDVELLVTPRGAKGGERGFELGLPRAAITTIDFLDLPDSVQEIRSNSRTLAARDLSSRNGQRKPIPLGPAEKLELSWKGPAPQPAQALQTAQATLDVRIDETQVTTEAELILQMKSGQTALWQIQAPAPPQATVEVDGAATDPRAPVVTPPPADAKVPVWTIKIKEPSDEPIKVRIRSRQPRAGKTISVLPFAVLQTIHQQGTLVVSVPPELRFRARTRGEVSQREVPEELRKAASNVAVFTYWNLPPTKADQLPASLLDLEVETIKGAVEVETAHSLRVADGGWQVTSDLDVTPVRALVERLEIELPDYELKAGPPLLVEPDLEVREMVGKRIGIVKLVQKQSRPFKVTLEGLCPLAKGAPPTTIALPRALQLTDKGARLGVALPVALELDSVREPGADLLTQDRRERTWRFEKAPARVELSWHERRAELPIESLADVTLADGQAQVRQRLRFLSPPEGLKEVTLRIADLPEGRTPRLDGQPLTARGAGVWLAPLKQPALALEYSFPLPAPDRSGRIKPFPLPLFWPDGATRCVTKVRIWSDPAVQPKLSAGPWEVLPTEAVPDHDSLTSLVLRSAGVEAPLTLALTRPSGAPLASVIVDRVLIQAALAEGEQQTYRARFLLGKVSGRQLDVELPASPAALNLEVLLDGLRVPTLQAIDEDGNESETGRIVRLQIEPELYRKPAVLELRYQIPPGRGDSQGRWQATLEPPRLRGSVMLGRARWLVSLPAEWLTFCPGSRVSVEQRWGWRSALPVLRPAAAPLDVERWFNASADETSDPAAGSIGLVCSQASPEAFVVWHVRERTWLLLCSLVFLALGLVLYFAALPRGLLWAAGLVLGGAVLVTALLWPDFLPLLVFGLPGVVVLLVVISLQWLIQWRYRRQVVFMPGFSRLAPGSSVLRANTGSSNRRRADPSTVDVPPASGL